MRDIHSNPQERVSARVGKTERRTGRLLFFTGAAIFFGGAVVRFFGEGWTLGIAGVGLGLMILGLWHNARKAAARSQQALGSSQTSPEGRSATFCA